MLLLMLLQNSRIELMRRTMIGFWPEYARNRNQMIINYKLGRIFDLIEWIALFYLNFFSIHLLTFCFSIKLESYSVQTVSPKIVYFFNPPALRIALIVTQ